jgi:hypothetical protein
VREERTPRSQLKCNSVSLSAGGVHDSSVAGGSIVTPTADPAIDKTAAAVCGLYCGACQVYIATTEDPARLAHLAERLQMTEEALACHGCRSDKRWPLCESCVMFECAARRGIEFCSQCSIYPCDDLRQFQAVMPHRRELWSDLDRIEAVGYEQWLGEIVSRYACTRCGTINSAYDLACRSCGTVPSCAYVADHRQALEAFMHSPDIMAENAMVTKRGSD